MKLKTPFHQAHLEQENATERCLTQVSRNWRIDQNKTNGHFNSLFDKVGKMTADQHLRLSRDTGNTRVAYKFSTFERDPVNLTIGLVIYLKTPNLELEKSFWKAF